MVEVIYVILTVAIILAAIGALILIARWQRRARRSVVKVFLANEGNVRGRFNLRAESAGSDLTFRFAINGASLPQTYTPATPQIGGGGGVPAAAAPATAEPLPSYTVPEPTGQPLASLVADLLMGVGYILPGSAGTGLMNAAGRIRYGQAVTDRAGKVAGRIGAVAGSTAQTGQQIAAAAGGGAKAAQAAGSQNASGSVVPTGPVVTWWQTPFLEPGADLELELVAAPTNSASAQVAGFKIVSRSAETDDAPLLTNEATVRIGGPAGLSRWIPYLAVIFLGIVALALLTAMRSLLASLIGG